MLRKVRVEDFSCEDTAHEVYIDDYLWMVGAELHRFKNAAGEPYSAIYRYGEEMMSSEREREDKLMQAFKQRMYAEKVKRRASWGR
jgi:hypothetical protein